MMQLRHPYSKIVFSKLLKENNLQKHLALLRCHHPDTYRHSCRVGLLCIDISLDLNLTAAELMLLGYAGLLHDLGKSRIPHQVLAKKSSLDRHEKEMMREHPRLGFLALLDSEYAAITSVVVAHHEFKRDPYPRQGKEHRRSQRASAERRAPSALMSNLAPIVAIADMYDALASPRSYKPRFPLKHITETLAAQFTGPSSYIDSIVQRHA